jgi:hypothetical protein
MSIDFSSRSFFREVDVHCIERFAGIEPLPFPLSRKLSRTAKAIEATHCVGTTSMSLDTPSRHERS